MFVAMKPLFDDARWDAVPLSDTQARWGPDGVNTGDIVSLRKFVEERIYTVPEELEIWDQILLTVEGKIPDDIEYWQGRTPREEAVTWFSGRVLPGPASDWQGSACVDGPQTWLVPDAAALSRLCGRKCH